MRQIKIILALTILLILAACNGDQDVAEVLHIEETAEEIFDEGEKYEIYIAVEENNKPALTAAPRSAPWRTHTTAPGDIIEFGGHNWIVLDVEDNYALIITEEAMVIGSGYYNPRFAATSWEASAIRRKLNSDFLYTFSAADRARIAETHVITEDNPWYDTSGGNDTVDRIFILSLQEVVRFFGDSGQLENRPEGLLESRWISDEYDYGRIGRNADGVPKTVWTRSPGGYQRLVTIVDPTGVIFLFGTGSGQIDHGARPVLWLNLETPWDEENFAEIREPLYLTDYTPHGDLAVQHILFMNDNLYGRKPFSYREKEAATWIIEELLSMGHPWENISVQEFAVEREERWNTQINNPTFRSHFEFRHATRLSQNVILTVPGQSDNGRFIVVGAHYDSHPTPGASDNASGVSLLLESAQRMLNLDNYYTIVYAFFGAEEVGLWGSTYFAGSLTYEQFDDMVMMINADVLFEGSYLIYSAAYGYDGFQPRQNTLTGRIDTIAYELDLGLIRYPYVLPNINTDHLPFFTRGHTVVNLMGLHRVESPFVDGLFSIDEGAFVLRVYHTPNDDFHIIEERWPGKMQTNMNAFSIFLEEMLMMR
ncbi:MAG: M28 family metallopeptidase [Defluviitaleaceae bacterium]|nr:M28 family metallopeptidase [Defluviitaleaceae bacterium]